MASSEQISTQAEAEAVINEFLEAMKKNDGDSEKGLEKAFQVLSKGQDNASVSAVVLHRAIQNRGLKLTIEDVKETILHVKPEMKDEVQIKEKDEVQINSEEFIKIMKLTEFLEAMKKNEGDSEEVLKKAFQVLSKGQDNASVSAAVLHHAIQKRGLKLTVEDVKETILHVKPKMKDEVQINCEEFIKIMKLAEFMEAMKKNEGDSEEALKKAFQVLSKDQDNASVSAVVLHRSIQKRGLKLTIEDVKETIFYVKLKEMDKVQINCEEFIKIMNLSREAMKKNEGDSEEELKKAFQVLSKGQDNASVSADVLHSAIQNRGLKLTIEDVKETILNVKSKEMDEVQINCEEFIKIMKLAEFMEAMKKKEGDSEEALKKAFQVLSKDQDNASVSAVVLHRSIQKRGLKLTIEDVKETIFYVKLKEMDKVQINCEEFIKIMNLSREAMKKNEGDSEEELKKAFQVLSKGQDNASVSADVLHSAIQNRGLKLTIEDVKETILKVKPNSKDEVQQINCEEFIKIMKLSQEAMKKKNEVLLRITFDVLSEGNNASVSADVLHREIQNRGLKLTIEDVKETILNVKSKEMDEVQINCEEFMKIMKLLEEPTLVDQLTKISGILGRKGKKRIVLYGESGVGKTWMARKASGRVLRLRQGKFDIAIWVYLNRIYEGLSLQESIAYQLSVLAAFEKSEAEEAKKKEELEKDKNKQEEPEENKEKKKQEKIERMIHEALRGKKLLVILDDEGSEMKLDRPQVDEKDNEERPILVLNNVGRKIGKDRIHLGKILNLDHLAYKVLITSKNPPASGDFGIMVRPLTLDDSKSLVFQGSDGVDMSNEIQELADFFIGKSGRLPAELLIIGKIVCYYGKSESGLQKLRNDKEILSNNSALKVEHVLIRGYERIPTSVLIDCYSPETPEKHFLHQGGMVNFNELISYWIMEGHLGHFDRIEDAYEEGHRVLMELMDCGLLKKQEADYVTSSGTRFDFDIHEYHEFFRNIRPGLATTFDMKLGRVALADGMIRTISSSDQEVKKLKLSALLLDGDRIREEVPANSLFESQSEVEVLAISNPTRQHFQLPIFKMRKLRLLVLRGCQFLDSIEKNFKWTNDQENSKDPHKSQSLPPPQISVLSPSLFPSLVKLENLTVLEISGPSSLKTIPDDLFSKMPNLKTLNMSYLQIELLPLSFYSLTKIEFLILRGCSSLRELGSLKNLKDLQVLDISGATSFEKFQDKSFHVNHKLQILNLSQSKIKTLPLINSLQDLKFISLRDCAVLSRLRMIARLKNLQILDISGAAEVEGFCDPSLEDLKKLVILDVSRTAIQRLPSNIANPKYLHLKGCSLLKELPPIEGFSNVEVIDLSGSCRLEEIKNQFFDNLECLRELNLSETRVKHLPFRSSLGTLRRLLLAKCEYLEKLENLSSLEKLEFLDLSGCKALKEMEDKSFEKMSRLWYLNLSGIQLEKLPSLSKLTELKELYVRDCPNLIEVPGLEELEKLEKLEILDHYGTILQPPSSFSNPDCRMRVLGPSTEEIDLQQLLEDLRAITAEVTSNKPESTDQQQHDQQPNMGTQGDGAEKWDFKQEDLKQCKWSISNWQGEAITDEKTQVKPVYGIHFLKHLNKYPSLLTKNFSRFHFLVYPAEALSDEFSYRNELFLRDIYFGQVSKKKLERCLEIREFDDFPPFLGHLLKQAQFIVLIDNPFFRSLLNLGVDNIKAMKACWIERCNELEHFIASEKVEDTNKPGQPAKSEGKRGESAKSEGKPGESVKNEGKRAESAKGEAKLGESAKGEGKSGESAKDEDKRGESAKSEGKPGESVKSKGKGAESAKGEGKLGESAKGEGKSGESAKDEDKPGESAKSEGKPGESAKSEGNLGKNFADILNNLEILWLSDVMKLRSISSGDIQSISFKSLKSLYLEYCPQLSMICSSSLQLESLEILYVKYCQKLKTLFPDDDSAKLEKLTELHLWGLDELKGIACKVPSLRTLRVGECPMLEHVIASNQGHENDELGGRGNLQILHIKFCDKLKIICEFQKEDVTAYFPNLQELELLALPELQKIACTAPSLHSLRVGECPSLQNIFGGSDRVPEDLKILEVKSCEKMKTIIKGDGPDGLVLGKVDKMELLGLPELENIGAELPLLNEDNCTIWACPKLQKPLLRQAQVEDSQNPESNNARNP